MTPATALANEALAAEGRTKEMVCDDDHDHWPIGCHPLSHGFAAAEERSFGIPYGTFMAIVRTWSSDTPVPDRYRGVPPSRYFPPPPGYVRPVGRHMRGLIVLRGGRP